MILLIDFVLIVTVLFNNSLRHLISTVRLQIFSTLVGSIKKMLGGMTI